MIKKEDDITFKENGNKTVFSCGCKTEVIGENFIISPCSLDCEVFKYVIELSKRQKNIVSYHINIENR